MIKLGVQSEFKYFLVVILAGILLGIIYDFFRAERKIKKHNNISVNIEDMFFCVLFAAIFLIVTYYLNSGVVRLSGIISLLIGLFLYFYLAKNKIVTILVFSFIRIEKIIKILFNIIIFPVKFLIHLFKKPVHIVIWFVNARIKKSKNRIKTLGYKLRNELKIIKSIKLKHK